MNSYISAFLEPSKLGVAKWMVLMDMDLDG